MELKAGPATARSHPRRTGVRPAHDDGREEGRRSGLFDSVAEALNDLRAGRMVVVVDDELRENEGDLLVAAEKMTASDIAFMARFARGLICLAVVGEVLDRLDIPMMMLEGNGSMTTAFTVSIDLAGQLHPTSAQARAATIRRALDPAARPQDFARPGHVFPLRARPGGVLLRPGHTEAAVDLGRLAGLFPAGVICEIMADDGSMARAPQLREFSDSHGLKMISIADLVEHRLAGGTESQ